MPEAIHSEPTGSADRLANSLEQMADHIAGILPHDHTLAWTVVRLVVKRIAGFPIALPEDAGTRLHDAPHHVDVLSFNRRCKPKGSGIDYWTVEPSGDYADECEAGLALAEEYLNFVGRYPTYGNATLLGSIVGSMVKKIVARGPNHLGEYRLSGVEGQFLRRVNEYAMGLAYAERHGLTATNVDEVAQ